MAELYKTPISTENGARETWNGSGKIVSVFNLITQSEWDRIFGKKKEKEKKEDE